MLKILNNLRPFFKNNYRRINVREYSRIIKVSPPTASTLLEKLRKQNLLKKEKEKIYINYFANKTNNLFIDLSRIYWSTLIKKSALIDYLNKELINPIIVLFGSFSKAEIKKGSDIDLAVFSVLKKDLNLKNFEKKLNRKIQLFLFKSREEIKNKELLNNILNGYKISGEW